MASVSFSGNFDCTFLTWSTVTLVPFSCGWYRAGIGERAGAVSVSYHVRSLRAGIGIGIMPFLPQLVSVSVSRYHYRTLHVAYKSLSRTPCGGQGLSGQKVIG